MNRIRPPYRPPIPYRALGTILFLAATLALPACASAATAWPYARPLEWLLGSRPASCEAPASGTLLWNRFAPAGPAWSDATTGDLPGLQQLPGLRIYLDPVTRHAVTPTPEQRRATAASLAPVAPDDDTPLPVERIPGGGEMIHLNGRHMVYEVARRDASGRFTTTCAPDSASATRLLSRPAPPERRWEEK